MQANHHFPNWLPNLLQASLKNLFSDCNSKDEKLAIIYDYQTSPSQDATNLYRGARKSQITNKLKQLLEADQTQLSPPGDSETTSTDDTFVPFLTEDPRNYHLDPKLPVSIKELLIYYYWRVRIPPDCSCHLKVGYFGRQGRTIIKPPSNPKIVCRIVTHLGPDEVYKLTKVDSSGKRGSSEEKVFTNGSYIVLNKQDLTSHNVFVSPNPHVKFPLPNNCDEMIQQGLSAVGSSSQFSKNAKMPNSDQVKQMMQRSGIGKPIIRPRTYRRLTIILDFESSSLVDDQRLLKIIDFNRGAGPAPPRNGNPKRQDWPDQLPNSIPPDIAKSLPPGIDTSIISRVAKDKQLSGMISKVAKGVAADLEGRDDLQGEQPQITGELVGAIANSAVQRIRPDKVRKLSKNVESVITDTNPNLPGISRKARRRRARRARKRNKKQPEFDPEMEI